VLRSRTKHDFRGYKKGTLQRRVERRMRVHHITSVRTRRFSTRSPCGSRSAPQRPAHWRDLLFP
jgi:hypothetical protein